MSEMIERVARAMIKQAGYDPEDRIMGSGSITRLDAYLPVARAAIEALCPATVEMSAVGDDALRRGGKFPSDDVWRAMIDEALK